MGFFSKLFGRAGSGSRRPRKVSPRAPATRPPMMSSIPPANMRRELLRLALRQSLSRNGIPVHWIGAEAVEVPGPGNPLHVRLLVQHWDERLPRLFLAFQEDFEERLLAVEPLARTWLRGFSWQFQLVDPTPHPRLPEPGTWLEGREVVSAPAPLVSAANAAAAAANAAAADRKIKEELERLFAHQDAARAMAPQQPDFEPTRQGNW